MFKNISELIPRSIKKVGIYQKLRSEQVEKIFREELEILLTKNILERLKILYFKDGVITIACLDDMIVERLKMHEESIIRKVNIVMCNNSLKSVRYLT
ncbi:MAG: hypothetical protein Q7T50_01155 [Candidatus Magasanikbacteria bacterium]|nr:hypothetical protein [Candidatus Magasanikbacteria bacterium]